MSMRPLAASLACVLLFGPVLTSRAQSQAPWIPDPYFQSWPENRAKVFSPATGPIAHARLRLNVSDRDVEIYRGKERLEVRRALELLVVAITNAPARKTPWDELVGNKITVVRSLSWPARWELHTDVGWEYLDLPDNVFTLQQAIPSQRSRPLRIRVNGAEFELKAGEVLLVLG